jgi:hypothetical protein
MRLERTYVLFLAAPLLALAGYACAGSDAPLRAQTSAVAAIRSANEVGAEGAPRAAYHLELAKEQVAAAQRLIAEDEMEAAERMLRRAQADADLAIALTRQQEANRDAERVRQQIRDLRQAQQ